jgi:hypothetical protein
MEWLTIMSKWADYAISSVRFNNAHTHIDQVQAAPDQGDSIGAASMYARTDVVAAIKRGVTFVTVFRGTNNNWNKGQPVVIDHVNGGEYIKTVPNGKAIDNLDNLPEF